MANPSLQVVPAISLVMDPSSSLWSPQTRESLRNFNEESVASSSLSDVFLVEKVFLSLRQGYLSSSSNYLFRSSDPSVVVEVLYRCRENLVLGQKFVETIMVHCPNFKHSSLSLSAMIHILVRCRKLPEAQGLILRMIRRSGASRVQIVESLVSTYVNCGSNSFVFDFLIRTFVQARKLREGSEAFRLLTSKGFCVSINACNALLGALLKVGWMDLAWNIYEDIVRSGTQMNAYTLNIMVNALCKDCRMDQVKPFLTEMGDKGIFPDTVTTYNTLISACCREGLVEEAFELMNSMKLKGLKPGLFYL
ncbi:hypothetical protein K1719_014400 [Acacia pycnantha]|nr:hypothetical protein K1719_014400 [Acacia pycnantha]